MHKPFGLSIALSMAMACQVQSERISNPASRPGPFPSFQYMLTGITAHDDFINGRPNNISSKTYPYDEQFGSHIVRATPSHVFDATYDPAGKKISLTHTSSSGEPPIKSITFTRYVHEANRTHRTEYDKTPGPKYGKETATYRLDFDRQDRPVLVESSFGESWRYTYGSSQHPVTKTETARFGPEKTYRYQCGYDSQGRITRRVSGSTSEFRYGKHGFIVATTWAAPGLVEQHRIEHPKIDGAGNWLEQEIYKLENVRGRSKWIPLYKTKRTITYH
ncbi:MAG: hypothetical protein OER86_03600 [Phycisphaerae bacterium]|nr:hypothetical protein [Phycisphaerae bacterium]